MSGDEPEIESAEPTELERSLAPRAEERLVDDGRQRRFAARARFFGLVLLVLFLHVVLIAAFLLRDAQSKFQTAAIEETPVEVIVEKPPEPPPPTPPPPPPPPPKPPEPPKPKEELEKPALSAPRAPNEEKIETEKIQPKTSVLKAPTPPSDGQPQPKAAVAPPKEAAPDESKEDAAKAPDDTKPDAEALDKAKPKTAKKTVTKQAKEAPKSKRKPNDALAALSGSSSLPELSFARPTPKSPVYGGTEDVRYLAIVEGMLESKVTQLPRTEHWRSGGHVVIFFHVDESGRVISRDFYVKSGYPDIDKIAMQALLAAQPFPPPPRGVEHGLLWGSQFDGQLPRITVTKR